MGTEVVLQINGWLLVGISIAGLGAALALSYALLRGMANMVIAGIHTKIETCQDALEKDIESAHFRADSAHRRIGRVEGVLMTQGIKIKN